MALTSSTVGPTSRAGAGSIRPVPANRILLALRRLSSQTRGHVPTTPGAACWTEPWRQSQRVFQRDRQYWNSVPGQTRRWQSLVGRQPPREGACNSLGLLYAFR